MTSQLDADLINLYHLARTALAETGQADIRHARMIWAANSYAVEPDVHMTPVGAYKLLERLLA